MDEIDEGVADAVFQPIRFKLITLLKDSSEPLYIEQIAKIVGESSRLVSHHLDILEEMGLVRSEFAIIKEASRPLAGRFFVTTPKTDKVLAKILTSLPKVAKRE